MLELRGQLGGELGIVVVGTWLRRGGFLRSLGGGWSAARKDCRIGPGQGSRGRRWALLLFLLVLVLPWWGIWRSGGLDGDG